MSIAIPEMPVNQGRPEPVPFGEVRGEPLNVRRPFRVAHQDQGGQTTGTLVTIPQLAGCLDKGASQDALIWVGRAHDEQL